MLIEPEKWLLIDQAKKNDFHIEVNWKPEDPLTNNCRIFKFTFPDGKEAYIKKGDLYQMLFACGQPEEQQKMIPQRLTKTRWYETVLGITATKDIRKGEKMTFPIKLSLPPIEQEVVSEIKKSYNLPEGFILKK